MALVGSADIESVAEEPVKLRSRSISQSNENIYSAPPADDIYEEVVAKSGLHEQMVQDIHNTSQRYIN